MGLLLARVSVAVGFACQYGDNAKQLPEIATPRRQWQKQSLDGAGSKPPALPTCRRPVRQPTIGGPRVTDPDILADRRRIRRKLSFWRFMTVVVAIALAAGLFARFQGTGRHGDHIARIGHVDRLVQHQVVARPRANGQRDPRHPARCMHRPQLCAHA